MDDERAITYVADDVMQAGLATTREYALAILRQGPAYHDEGARAIVWEHGRRNFGLRADGVLNVVCPVLDDSDVCGVGIFDASVAEVEAIMAGDPGVQAGVFVSTCTPAAASRATPSPAEAAGPPTQPACSRREAVDVAGEERDLADVGGAGEAGDPALEADGEAAVGRHAVTERLEVAGERLGVGVAEGGEVVGVAVEALPAGDELEAAEQQVEAVRGPGRVADRGGCRTAASTIG